MVLFLLLLSFSLNPAKNPSSLSVIIGFLTLRSLFFLSPASVNYIFTRLDRALITAQVIAPSNATPEIPRLPNWIAEIIPSEADLMNLRNEPMIRCICKNFSLTLHPKTKYLPRHIIKGKNILRREILCF